MSHYAPAMPVSFPWIRLLPWMIAVSGAGILGWSLLMVLERGDWLLVLPFLVLAVGAECLNVQVYEANQQKISLSFTIAVTMAAVAVQPTLAPLVSLTAAC